MTMVDARLREPVPSFARDVSTDSLTIDQLVRPYCTMVYVEAGIYEEAARRLKVDRRTVKARIDDELLEAICMNASPSGPISGNDNGTFTRRTY